MEMTHTMPVTLTDEHVDRFGRLKASTLLWFAQEAAGEHCKKLGTDDKDFDGLFWAVLRHRVEIDRLPCKGETVFVKTWPLPTTRVAFPRATEAYDEEGRRLYRIISIWILMDEKSRAMVLPGRSGVDVPGVVLGTELPVPANLTGLRTEKQTARTVTPAEIDKNRHMNNTCYLAWATQLLEEAFLESHTLKSFTVCYLSEAVLDQEITMSWAVEETGILSVEGVRLCAEKPERVFSVKMEFDGIM